MFLDEKGEFYIRIEGRFESAHYLYEYFPDGSDEPIHGHSWKVEVYLAGKNGLRADGISYDFISAKSKLKELVDTIDHLMINDLPEFKGVNPTSENIAKWFFYGLKSSVDETGGIIQKIVIHEGPENIAYFIPGKK
ncbi:6-pyruvoyl trahydropterin synthase family protein [Leptospira sp. GIMC2001]|uniref:6-pyruvoyl trahydropterin synthase family protein n=1 Tax=Leptospira sp. GIMC2001 TaxID=1513297 RepID=UPI00234BC68E|nr:6-carboxytetrahydropterin synthase [Leptospira sp. GIMC2001]WCL50306.1 6-carboxytetrahydropterin synthase [Leptospira sp. GIMC2001]